MSRHRCHSISLITHAQLDQIYVQNGVTAEKLV